VRAALASPLGPDGAPGRSLPGKFTWFDLATEDPAGARAFYGAVFGWTFRDVSGASGPYVVIEHAGGKVGGLFRRARPAGAPTGARWLSLLSVGDAQRAARYVRERGGQVVVAPVSVPGRGTHAVFRDPKARFSACWPQRTAIPPDAPVDDGDVFWLDLFARDPAKAAAFYSGLAGYEVTAPEPPRRASRGGCWPRADSRGRASRPCPRRWRRPDGFPTSS